MFSESMAVPPVGAAGRGAWRYNSGSRDNGQPSGQEEPLMAWIIGIDEAGYGPNLGPLVMTAVACRVPDRAAGADLWQLLGSAVRSGREEDDGRLLVDDSKVVYSTVRGLLGLERGVLATLWRGNGTAAALRHLIDWACPDDRADLE